MDQRLKLWRLTPIAAEDDPLWQGRPIYERVLVAARCAGEALAVAADFAGDGLRRNEVARPFRPGLEHPRLYRLDRIGEAPADIFQAQIVEVQKQTRAGD